MTFKPKNMANDGNSDAMNPFDMVDAEEPLKVGHFRHWLDHYFSPHADRDDQQSGHIREMRRVLLGENGDRTGSMLHKVEDMWETSRRLDTYMTGMRRLAGFLVGGVGLLTMVVALGHNLGWW